MNPHASHDGDRPLGMHRLAMLNIPKYREGIVEEIIDKICNEKTAEKCPHMVKMSTQVVKPRGHEDTILDSITYIAITDDNTELDNLVEAAEELRLEDRDGALSVLGRSPFNASRLSVNELRNMVRRQNIQGLAAWCNLLVAASMAAVGLAVDSSATVVASMLVSPLMAPIVQVSFALVDHKLMLEPGFICKAVCDFVLAVLACVAVGFSLGLLFVWTDVDIAWSWPTSEMASRTKGLHTLAPGSVIAIVSGIGVANGLRNSGVNALVGVAISASLLPPLVNSGMYFAWGLICDKVASMHQQGHCKAVSESESFYKGWISFLLTVINVLGVIVSAAMWFRLRGVGSSLESGSKRLRKDAETPLLAA